MQLFRCTQEELQYFAQQWQDMYTQQEQQLAAAFGKIEEWCRQCSARNENWIFFGIFVDLGKKKQLLDLCNRATEWIQDKRASWSTTVPQVDAKLVELLQQQELILHPSSPAVKPAMEQQQHLAMSATRSPTSFPCATTCTQQPQVQAPPVVNGSRAMHRNPPPVKYENPLRQVSGGAKSYAETAKGAASDGSAQPPHRPVVTSKHTDSYDISRRYCSRLAAQSDACR